MAIYTPTKLSDGALPTASATLYTVAAGQTVILKEIILANTATSNVNATITAGGLQLIPNVLLSGNSVVTFDFSKVMAAGDILAGLASTTAVNAFISGAVIS